MAEMFWKIGGARLLTYVPENGPIYQATDWDIIWPFAQANFLTEFEANMLADMCRGYFDAMVQGENPLAIPPVEQEDVRHG